MINTIKKRDGTVVAFDADKLVHWAKWASVVGADWFSIVAAAYEKCSDGCTTKELQSAMIQACIDKEDESHLLMAGRLLIGDVYKEAFGGHDKIPTVKQMYHNMVSKGLWEDMGYTDEELNIAESIINHKQDLKSRHSVINQVVTKYALSNVETGQVLETPAFVWMRMSLGICKNEDASNKMKEVAAYYKDFSLGKINAPTPNIKNLGTPNKGYASCCIYKSGDSIDSLAAGDHIAYKMTAASAGIGAMIETRTKGDGVRGNTIKHSGKLPYYSAIESMVKANKQGSRGGSATTHINCLDPEIETLLRLRHPTTPKSKKIEGIDYSFGYHPYLVRKAAANEKWMLVSFKDAPEVYEAMYSGNEKAFEHAYDAYESSKKKRKCISARKLVNEFLRMEEETGRMYEHNPYEMNRHTPFLDPVYSSNLC